MWAVVNVPAGSFRGQKMVSTPNWELKVIGGGEPLDTDAENLNSRPLQKQHGFFIAEPALHALGSS